MDKGSKWKIDVQVANKHMQSCLTSFTSKIQIKPSHLSEWLKFKIMATPKPGKDVKKVDHVCTVDENVCKME